MKEKTINYLRIGSSIFLGLMLALNLYYIVAYRIDVQEAMGFKEPDRLMKLFEERTNTKCLCANPDFGEVRYIPNNPYFFERGPEFSGLP